MVSRLARLLIPVVALAVAGCTAVPQGGAVRKVPAPKNADVVQDLANQVANGPPKDASPQQVVDKLIVAMQSPDPAIISEYLTTSYAPVWRGTYATRTAVFSGLTSPKPSTGGNAARTPVSLDLVLAGVIDSHGNWARSGERATIGFDLVNVGGQWRIDHISQPGLFISLDSLSQVIEPVHLYYPSQEHSGAATVPRLVPDTVYKTRPTEGDVIQQLVSGPSAWIAAGVTNPVPGGATFNGVQTDGNGLTTFNFSGLQSLRTGSSQALHTFEAQLAYTVGGSQWAGQASSIEIDNDGQPLDQPYSMDTISKAYDPDLLDAHSPLYYVDAAHHLVERDTAQDATVAEAPTTLPTPTIELEHLDNVSKIAVSPTLPLGGTGTQLAAGVAPDHKTLELASLGDQRADPWQAVPIPDALQLSAPTFAVTGNAVWVVATPANGQSRLYAVPLSGTTPGTPGTTPGTPVVVPVTSDVGVPAVKPLTAAKLSRDGSRIAFISDRSAYVGVVQQLPTGGWQVTKARPLSDPTKHVSQVDIAWQDRFTVGVVTQLRVSPDDLRAGVQRTTGLLTAQADGTPNNVPSGLSALPVVVDSTPPLALQFAGAPSKSWVAAVGGKMYQQPSSTDGQVVDPRWSSFDTGSAPTYAD